MDFLTPKRTFADSFGDGSTAEIQLLGAYILITSREKGVVTEVAVDTDDLLEFVRELKAAQSTELD